MPARPIESGGKITVIYGNGDSLRQVTGLPGKVMGSPELIGVIPGMFSFAMRGPQAASTEKGTVVTVCTKEGDIICYKEGSNHQWKKTAQLNKPLTAKEGLMSLAGEGNHLVAVWLNAQEKKGQSIYAGISTDGGETWSAREIYTSPDGTTCECCKPSVAMRNNTVYVMFRNWINGSRDMYLMKSEDGGLNFAKAEQVGSGNWKLNGCPMDGGDLRVNDKQEAVVIWRREGQLFTSTGAGNETLLTEGKNGSVQPQGNGNAYAWTDKGMVMVRTADGQQHMLGGGSGPTLTTLKDGRLLCTWQRDKAILGWLQTESSHGNHVKP